MTKSHTKKKKIKQKNFYKWERKLPQWQREFIDFERKALVTEYSKFAGVCYRLNQAMEKLDEQLRIANGPIQNLERCMTAIWATLESINTSRGEKAK